MWSDEEWAIVQKCQDDANHGYFAHARVWSNHALRYVPTTCDACKKLIQDLITKKLTDKEA